MYPAQIFTSNIPSSNWRTEEKQDEIPLFLLPLVFLCFFCSQDNCSKSQIDVVQQLLELQIDAQITKSVKRSRKSHKKLATNVDFTIRIYCRPNPLRTID